MNKNEKGLLTLLLIIVAVLLIWFFVLNKYKSVNDLPDVDLATPVVEQPIKINNVLETTVSVVDPNAE